jgi:hypothetical protein
MDKIGGTISLIIALFLLVGMLMHLDTPTMAGMAIVALVVLAVYQFRPRVPRG